MKRRQFIKSSTATAGLILGQRFGWGASTDKSPALLLEAAQFQTKGGWVLDQQFMDQMGSAFLLAHGLGKPVADAVAKVRLPEAGSYRLWVRTRDWVAPWKTPDTMPDKRAKGTPGIFKVLVGGKAVPVTFGDRRADWHWQDGGTIEIEDLETDIALNDLTGFEGRCAGIFLTKDRDFTPPSEGEALQKFRRAWHGYDEQPEDAGDYDLVVVGGGMAGTCAAVRAARNGLKVAFIQDRPVVGGNNSSEVRVWLHGAKRGPRARNLGNILAEFEQEERAHYGPENKAHLYEDDKKLAVVGAEENIRFFPSHRMNKVETKGSRIQAVIAEQTETGKRLRFTGKLFADCTGDGCVGHLAGADFEMTIEEGHMGRCNLWHAEDTKQPQTFPRCPWALDLSRKPFPGRNKSPAKGIKELGGWYWESGFYHDPFEKNEYIRDWNFRAMYGAWDALKNVDEAYGSYEIGWAAYVSGKRESRRLMGDLVLNKEDVTKPNLYEDGLVATGWKIDLHLPHPKYVKGFEGDAFISKAHFTDCHQPYYVPYRCLYSRNIGNLFMAGRCISVTHEALGTVRVMRTCALMGEAVGMAAAICQAHDVDPRAVYTEHLDELKTLCGIDENPGLVVQPAGSARRVNDERPTFEIAKLPNDLEALPSVAVERGAFSQPGQGYEFRIDAAASVFLSVHSRGDYSPPGDWEETPLRLTWFKDVTDKVYRKDFPAGIVRIPPHDTIEGKNYGVPHLAFVKGSGVSISKVKD